MTAGQFLITLLEGLQLLAFSRVASSAISLPEANVTVRCLLASVTYFLKSRFKTGFRLEHVHDIGEVLLIDFKRRDITDG